MIAIANNPSLNAPVRPVSQCPRSRTTLDAIAGSARLRQRNRRATQLHAAFLRLHDRIPAVPHRSAERPWTLPISAPSRPATIRSRATGALGCSRWPSRPPWRARTGLAGVCFRLVVREADASRVDVMSQLRPVNASAARPVVRDLRVVGCTRSATSLLLHRQARLLAWRWCERTNFTRKSQEGGHPCLTHPPTARRFATSRGSSG